MTAYPAMYGPMAHHYGNDVSALTPGSTEGSAHGKPMSSSPEILWLPNNILTAPEIMSQRSIRPPSP